LTIVRSLFSSPRTISFKPDKSSGKRVQDIEIHFRFDVAVSTISVETGKYGKKVA